MPHGRLNWLILVGLLVRGLDFGREIIVVSLTSHFLAGHVGVGIAKI